MFRTLLAAVMTSVVLAASAAFPMPAAVAAPAQPAASACPTLTSDPNLTITSYIEVTVAGCNNAAGWRAELVPDSRKGKPFLIGTSAERWFQPNRQVLYKSGFRPGHTYQVRVLGTDPITGKRAWRTAKQRIHLRASTELAGFMVLNPASTVIQVGLTRDVWNGYWAEPFAGRPVTIFWRPTPTSAWKLFSTKVTGKHGAFSFTLPRASVSGEEWRFDFKRTPTFEAATMWSGVK